MLIYALGLSQTSATGFLMDDHFYGTVYMREAVHYLEPHQRKSKDLHIFGDGLKTLLHKLEPSFCAILASVCTVEP